jgi:ribose 5-phosphate isomerase B
MPIAIACDHGGLELKEAVKAELDALSEKYVDLGPDSPEAVDYPDYGEKVAGMVSSGQADRGILICGTGIGMSIVANKYPNVRAALVTNEFMAKMASEHNDANILVLGGRVVSAQLGRDMVRAWLKTPFSGNDRHARRLEKIRNLEKRLIHGGVK